MEISLIPTNQNLMLVSCENVELLNFGLKLDNKV